MQNRVLPLVGGAVELVSAEDAGRECAWALSTPGRDYYFAAETEEERSEWVAAIRAQVEKSSVTTTSRIYT